MRVYKKNEQGWFCGYWNGSPVQIKHSSGNKVKDEQKHSHNFSEYYLVINGKLRVKVGRRIVKVGKLELLMIKGGEIHQITGKSPKCEYVIIKEESYPDNKKY